ncbi:hypothetical protein [Streptomyces sp. Da 82-17]|uniref:hypothetical protein n=1 Tax=Streptomyces sp. Da 82-17 TaxID=3377116 RepID=UPI0038D40A14
MAVGPGQVVLRELGLHNVQAMAAVASDDLDNLAVRVAARAVSADLRVAIRARHHAANAGTQSLFCVDRPRPPSLSAACTVAGLPD